MLMCKKYTLTKKEARAGIEDSIFVHECFPTTHFSVFVLSLWTVCTDSFSEEILEHNLDGLVASDEPAPRNSCTEELKQVVTEESIKYGRTEPSNCPEAVRKILIVDDEEPEKKKESRIPLNT